MSVSRGRVLKVLLLKLRVDDAFVHWFRPVVAGLIKSIPQEVLQRQPLRYPLQFDENGHAIFRVRLAFANTSDHSTVTLEDDSTVSFDYVPYSMTSASRVSGVKIDLERGRKLHNACIRIRGVECYGLKDFSAIMFRLMQSGKHVEF